MDKDALPNVMAERLRLRANIWRRDAEAAMNPEIIRLMVQSSDELEQEAVRLDHSGKFDIA
jgi:hypothetical protein